MHKEEQKHVFDACMLSKPNASYEAYMYWYICVEYLIFLPVIQWLAIQAAGVTEKIKIPCTKFTLGVREKERERGREWERQERVRERVKERKRVRERGASENQWGRTRWTYSLIFDVQQLPWFLKAVYVTPILLQKSPDNAKCSFPTSNHSETLWMEFQSSGTLPW